MDITNVSISWRVPDYTEALVQQKHDSQKADILQSIDCKIKSGRTLSSSERTYLQIYAPDIFDILSRIKMEHAAASYDNGKVIDLRG